MAEVTIRLDRAQIRAIESDPPTRFEVLAAGRGVAGRAATLAPKRTGAGASSINAHISTEDRNAADVTWSNMFPYLVFHEDGTQYVPAQHFLLHALEHYSHH